MSFNLLNIIPKIFSYFFKVIFLIILNGTKFSCFLLYFSFNFRSYFSNYRDPYLVVFEILRSRFYGVPDDKSCRFIKIALNLADSGFITAPSSLCYLED